MSRGEKKQDWAALVVMMCGFGMWLAMGCWLAGRMMAWITR